MGKTAWKIIAVAFLAALVIAGCERRIDATVISNTSSSEDMSLLELARYELDPSEFKACKLDELEPLDVVWELTPEQREISDEIADGAPPDELAKRAIDFAQDLELEISARDRESIVMHLFKTGAEMQDAMAMSEIGASLLFCYNHVQQDLSRAKSFLNRASELGDSYAMRSLASMYLSGLTDDKDAGAKGRALLEKCQRLRNEQCQISPKTLEQMTVEGL